MSEYAEDCREEDRWLGRLMFDEVCEIRPNESLRMECVAGIYTTSIVRKGEWHVCGTSINACSAVDALLYFLEITDEEIEANAERRA